MILITGAARSGTSLIAGIIEICGGYGGTMFGAHPHNRKGMFENTYIRENIMKPYLKQIGADERCQYPLPKKRKIKDIPNLEMKINDIFKEQGWDGRQTLFYKCTKINHVWNVWDSNFPVAKWVIVRRDSNNIVNSCMRTGFMRAFNNEWVRRQVNAKTTEEGWFWWVRQHEKRFKEIKHHTNNNIEIYPSKMVEGDFSEIKGLITWLGLEWKEKEVKQFIEPKLFHTKKKGGK